MKAQRIHARVNIIFIQQECVKDSYIFVEEVGVKLFRYFCSISHYDIHPIVLNPLISITPSEPLISLGSWLTLQIYYLSAVKYDPETTDLIFIRVNITQDQGRGAYSKLLNPLILSGSLFTLRPYATMLERFQYLPGEKGGGGCLNPIFSPFIL